MLCKYDVLTRHSFPVVLVLAAGAACYTEPTVPAPSVTGGVPVPAEPVATVAPSETEADRGIRTDLVTAIRRDPHLKDREINFLVTNGDISVTGVVKDERERRRINELAMNITGVKSVANALRVAE